MSKYIALFGAGFSRNWGGWLASEAFEYLLGFPDLDNEVRTILWNHNKTAGGFEAAIEELQAERSNESLLENLQAAVRKMFDDMNAGLSTVSFEPGNYREYQVQSFLHRFDAIFTLNQDLLLEYKYLNANVSLSIRWDGWQIPGMRHVRSPSTADVGTWSSGEEANFQIDVRQQPYIKLHGSSNWTDRTDQQLLVIGGGKASTIQRHPILRWNAEQFRKHLSQPDTRLMVIGYGFGDAHINDTIIEAAEGGELRVFIIDPEGVGVINRKPSRTQEGHYFGEPDPLVSALQPHIIGASRRPLNQVFHVEHIVEWNKIMRFFD